MPNRIIKESICTSDTTDKMTWFEEVFFYRLMVNADDFGRYDARPRILNARLFPLKNDIREDQIVNALYRLSLLDIVRVYIYDERPYLQLKTWSEHQQIRNKRSKYPEPSQSVAINFKQVNKDKITAKDFLAICNHLITNDSECCRNTIQSESNLNSKRIVCSEMTEPKKTQDSPAVLLMPLVSGEEFIVTEDVIAGWQELYPAVDILQELRKMVGWLDANPKRKKTSRGIKRFITNWLSKEQDNGGYQNRDNSKKIAPSANRFHNFDQRDYDFNQIEKKLLNKQIHKCT